MVRLEFNIQIDEAGKMTIVSNVLSLSDAKKLEEDVANAMNYMIQNLTKEIARVEGVEFTMDVGMQISTGESKNGLENSETTKRITS